MANKEKNMGLEDIFSAINQINETNKKNHEEFYASYGNDMIRIYSIATTLGVLIPLIELAVIGTCVYLYFNTNNFFQQLSYMILIQAIVWPLDFVLKKLEFEIRQVGLWGIKRKQEEFVIKRAELNSQYKKETK